MHHLVLLSLTKHLHVLEVIENYYHPQLVRDDTGRLMQLDVYLPKERLAFEYQGEQHYYDVYALGQLWAQKESDKEKRTLCKNQGITLIEVPYWWDFQKSSLVATIHQVAPHIIPSKGTGEYIPTEPPHGFPNGLFILVVIHV